MDFKGITDRFNVKYRSRNTVKAICPSHNDKNASLSITLDSSTNKIMFKCHAGCETKDILECVGLTFEDLGSCMEDKDPNIEAIYKYYDEKGNLLFEKIRFIGKKFMQRRYVNGCVVWGLKGGSYFEKSPNEYITKEVPGAKKREFIGQEPYLYNLPNVIRAINKGHNIYIVEGEKDAETLNKKGFIATTSSNGCSSWKDEYNQYFIGANVVILPDNDEAGQKYCKMIKNKLRGYTHSIRDIVISDKPKGDITDWFNEGHTIDEFKLIVSQIERKYAPWIMTNSKGKISVNEGMLASSIKNNLKYFMVGDPANERNLIFIYEGGVYKEVSVLALKSISINYIPAPYIKHQLINNVAGLLTAKEPLPYSILEGKENIINLKNGLYNVDTKILKPHDINYISSSQLSVSYNENPYNNGYWDSFISTLTQNDNDLKLILQEWYGLVLSNYKGSLSKKLLVLYGAGNTGKSKVMELLINMLGISNTKNIPVQKLGDRFTLGNIQNKRLVYNADLPTGKISDEALNILKLMTGGDSISVERKGKDDFDVEYRGLIMYSTNKLPTITGDLGNHVFERFLIIPCNNPIPIEQQDPRIMDRLLMDKEYIFQWAMEGLDRLIRNNFKYSYSKQVEDIRERYSIDSDSVRAFIRENYMITGIKKNRIRSSFLYEHYKEWSIKSEYVPCSIKNFKARMENIPNVIYNHRFEGYPYYEGIEKDEFSPTEIEENPFE